MRFTDLKVPLFLQKTLAGRSSRLKVPIKQLISYFSNNVDFLEIWGRKKEIKPILDLYESF